MRHLFNILYQKYFGSEEKQIEAYGIKAVTYGLNRYPLICNLVKQFLFISDEETLVKSTIYSNDGFIVDCVEQIGESSFEGIQNDIDEMLYVSEEIIELKNKVKNEKEKGYPDNETNVETIKDREELIRRLYRDCQMDIFTIYFDKLYNKIKTKEDIEEYRNKIDSYRELIGFNIDKTEEDYLEYYDTYVLTKEEMLEEKEEEIKRKTEMALVVVSENPIINFFEKIKNSILRIIKR